MGRSNKTETTIAQEQAIQARLLPHNYIVHCASCNERRIIHRDRSEQCASLLFEQGWRVRGGKLRCPKDAVLAADEVEAEALAEQQEEQRRQESLQEAPPVEEIITTVTTVEHTEEPAPALKKRAR